ncbi:DedA family protein [Soehngenia longivitae]|uniref:DedA family protein n=1 Tax=Soehngenia longivitae TaxID=2562294 RepID=A0A4Z0D4P2_9FIRM|nr:DedA family protein [Soehngenia longivitae]TFZ39384.1 DedA family protein [Soehngenia longivitae]
MQDLMIDFVNNYGYFAIFILIYIENIFPPIPSEVVLLSGGALTVITDMNVLGTIIFATIGSLVGAITLYSVGRAINKESLVNFLSGKIGRRLKLKPEAIDKAQIWFMKYQEKAVLICRCIPIVRSIISIPAGFAKMNVLKFILLTLIGSLVWNTILVNLGALFGEAWEKVLIYYTGYQYLILGAIAVGIIYLWIKFRKKKNN